MIETRLTSRQVMYRGFMRMSPKENSSQLYIRLFQDVTNPTRSFSKQRVGKTGHVATV